MKEKARRFALTSAAGRSEALLAMADALEEGIEKVLRENGRDLETAKMEGLEEKRIRIMTIMKGDLEEMASFFRTCAGYADPVGSLISSEYKPNGLKREKRFVPLGVVAMVYEARPSVVTDSAALCIRTGNALLLRGSRHCRLTDRAIVECLRLGLQKAGLPEEIIGLVSDGNHQLTYELAREDRFVDLMIVRGGYDALRDIKEKATVPVIGAGPGNCHIYIDAEAEPSMAKAVVENSKVPRPLACNAIETVLVHREWAKEHLRELLEELEQKGIAIKGCPETVSLYPNAELAAESDWEKEYFAPILAVRIVSDVSEAIEHINRYRTPHTESIITENRENANRFLAEVEANVVCHNASTRLTDGMEFGLGGEMGISTQKIPCGGPIGMRSLMQEKYYLIGNGTLR